MLIRSASGLRGIAEDHFTPELIDKYISAFISTQNIKSCVIGRDGRPSGKQISQWVIDSFHKNGINVENCGLATTPTMQVMTEKENFDGGIVITASHNPSEYNGLKFLQTDGTFLSPEQCEELFKAVDQNVSIDPPDSLGVVSDYSTANEEHIDKVLAAKCIDIDNIRKNNFKVVIDAVNGAGSFILPMLCERLDCEVITMNCSGDGDFSRIPEPLAENLEALEQKVLEVGADIGFATDPDGDRLSIVSNKGKAIGEEYTLVLAVKNYSNFQESMVVTNLSTSMMLDDITNKTIRTRIGEAHVVQKMNELNISIGGEGNGGVILKEAHLGRDSLVAVSMILSLLSISGKSISDEISSIPKYLMVKDKIFLNSKIDFDSLESIFDCDEINRLDGIKFSWSDKWIHIRKSNTEPIIRIFAEAPTKDKVDELVNTLKNYVK
ncbi:phosphoglucosamine mutase [Candidatus Marinimicrobia bacterium]|nr:phosphoglucosamine mutase [Candidatus Neomarinimicrobiota bacterium]MDA9735750.1 phosphoglucosamine mutase [Candidatus Neomarinimicrobiota bacterium]